MLAVLGSHDPTLALRGRASSQTLALGTLWAWTVHLFTGGYEEASSSHWSEGNCWSTSPIAPRHRPPALQCSPSATSRGETKTSPAAYSSWGSSGRGCRLSRWSGARSAEGRRSPSANHQAFTAEQGGAISARRHGRSQHDASCQCEIAGQSLNQQVNALWLEGGGPVL
jgi:hypothetical protein